MLTISIKMLLSFVILFSIYFCNGNGESGAYDQIQFSQKPPVSAYYEVRRQWPRRNMNFKIACLTKNGCNAVLNPTSWILHGLWPHNRTGESPRKCLKQETPVMASVESTISQLLDKRWPYLGNSIKNKFSGKFWDLEWYKYGSCLNDIAILNTPSTYFMQALEMLKLYNIGKVLQDYEFKLGETFPLEHIFSVIQHEYQVKPNIKCISDNSSQRRQFLFAVVLCFNKTMNLENCDKDESHACNSKRNIIYPNILKA